MGIRITTDDKPVKVYRKDYNGRPSYSIMLSKKEGDDWVRIYKPIRFKTGYAVSDGQYITIQDGFPVVDSWVGKDNQQYKREVWMITKFDSDTPYTAPREDAPEGTIEGFSTVDEGIPF